MRIIRPMEYIPGESELFEPTSGVIQDFESSLKARIKQIWDEDN